MNFYANNRSLSTTTCDRSRSDATSEHRRPNTVEATRIRRLVTDVVQISRITTIASEISEATARKARTKTSPRRTKRLALIANKSKLKENAAKKFCGRRK